MRRVHRTLLVGAAGLLVAACGASAGAGAGAPSWVPSPALGADGGGPGAQASPIVPGPPHPTRPRPGSVAPGARTPSPSKTHRIDPDVVAAHLTAPVGLAMMPDGTALVGERTTGRIVRVQPVAGRPVPTVRTLRGIDAAGDGGLLDLALSPTYNEDGLIYAYLTTATDNRVVDFTLRGPVTPVLIGIPKGATDNTGRLAFGPGGDLYVGTGDAGHPTLAADRHSLAGKVLRIDSIGDPAQGGPIPGSPVWTTGHRVVDGLCPVRGTQSMLEVEAGPTDDVNELIGGSSYGWPASAGPGRAPVTVLPRADRSPGGCAVLTGRIWVTSLDGRALLTAPLRHSAGNVVAGPFGATLVRKYGRLRTVVAAADGALWLTTSNRDGHGSPVSSDERVIRYVPAAAAGGSPL